MDTVRQQTSQKIALSIEQAIELSGICRTNLYKQLKSGSLPARKLGKRTLILSDDLNAFLAGLASYPAQERGQ